MFFYLLVFIFGLIVGSFLNVVILRLKSGEKIVLDRSHCPNCKKTLKTQDLIPVLSFLVYRGKCKYCKKKISWQYPLVELATGILFVIATYQLIGLVNPFLAFYSLKVLIFWLRNLAIIGVLIVIFVYDLRWYLILDRVSLPAIVGFFLINLFLGISPLNMILAGLIGLGFFGIQFAVSKGKWIGGGDLRLGFLMGVILGWPNILVGLFLSYMIGAVISILLVWFKKKKAKSQVPFGTFLTIGTYIALLWGDSIMRWYLNML